MDMMWGMWGMGSMMLLWALGWFLVLVALGLAIWWLVRQARPAPQDRALDVLRERYARGEITREEFEARRRDLVA
ncbi:MAG: SHOCT domain-containing protein [Candidatus Rokuibacteriota bacterium]